MTPAFEQFARSKGWPTWRKPDGKTYIDTRVQFAWTVWEYLGENDVPAECDPPAACRPPAG